MRAASLPKRSRGEAEEQEPESAPIEGTEVGCRVQGLPADAARAAEWALVQLSLWLCAVAARAAGVTRWPAGSRGAGVLLGSPARAGRAWRQG